MALLQEEKMVENPWADVERRATSRNINKAVVYEMPHGEFFHGARDYWGHVTIQNNEALPVPQPTKPNYLYLDALAVARTFPVRLVWRSVQKQQDANLYRFLRNPDDIRKDFEEELGKWDKETGFLSSLDAKIMHPSYLRIIGMGKQVLPFIFEQMKRAPGHWFVALRAISGENPVDNGADLITATDQWISWGRSNGFTE